MKPGVDRGDAGSAPPVLRTFGPGKVILFGEHSVVHGYSAVAAPLTRGVYAYVEASDTCTIVAPKKLSRQGAQHLRQTFARAAALCGSPPVRVRLQSTLPMGVGLGSSAALSVACARALLAAGHRTASPTDVLHVALAMEQGFHGIPSGVDHTCSVRDELIHFRRAPDADTPQVHRVSCPRALHLVIALAGARQSTAATVSSLARSKQHWPQRYGRLLADIGAVSDEGLAAIEAGDVDAVGDAMNVNQGLLNALGLSSPAIEHLVHRLRAMGAHGAKLTGAGGSGGAVIGLFDDPVAAVSRLYANGIAAFQFSISA
jgi:mevalonate kinase